MAINLLHDAVIHITSYLFSFLFSENLNFLKFQ